MNVNVKTPAYVIELARELRKRMTPTEKILWQELRYGKIDGFRFRKQHPVYRFILDYYCSEKLLAVEVDGVVHNEQKEYDRYRDEFLLSLGIRTLRFLNDEIEGELDSVVFRIKLALRD